ncbi:MAG: ribosomal protein S18-alanine N-acetyltransferase [Terriglobia bacterium]
MMIRRFIADDLRGVLAIQQEAGPGNSWRGDDYARLAEESGGLILVAGQGNPEPDEIWGFVALRRVLDHAEILNLAVHPARRRLGIAKALLAEACRRAFEDGAKTLSLEVRASNHPAIELYRSLGFSLRAVRKDYYTDPVEDAQVLMLTLSTLSL